MLQNEPLVVQQIEHVFVLYGMPLILLDPRRWQSCRHSLSHGEKEYSVEYIYLTINVFHGIHGILFFSVELGVVTILVR